MKSVKIILTPEAADVYYNFLNQASDFKQAEIILNFSSKSRSAKG